MDTLASTDDDDDAAPWAISLLIPIRIDVRNMDDELPT